MLFLFFILEIALPNPTITPPFQFREVSFKDGGGEVLGSEVSKGDWRTMGMPREVTNLPSTPDGYP